MIRFKDPRVSEAACLASMIISPAIIPSILETIVDESDFFYPEHQTLFFVIFKKFISGDAIDGALVREELNRTGELEAIGGFDYLKRMLESVPSAANGVYYAKSVRQHRQQRDIIAASEAIHGISGNGSIDEQIDEIQKIVNNLNQQQGNDSHNFRDSVDNVIAANKLEKPCLKTGFRDLDYYIGGFRTGEFIVLAARPGIGKSALALQVAINIAKHDKKILFFSFEMSHSSIIERALLSNSSSDLKTLDVTINETSNKIDQLIAFTKGRKKLSGIDLVVVDYLQLMSDSTKENRCQEISNISRKLKLLAMQESIPILALSQLNRQVENRPNHRPFLADLRESGSIEQDADVVCLLTREDFYRQQLDPKAETDGRTEVIIAKNRNGKTGILELIFLGDRVIFGDKNNNFIDSFK